jgi:signal transduction histidine kinase
LGLIGKMLQDQQRRIRSFVENAQPKSDNEPQFLKERLEAFSLALSSQWSCSLSIDVNPADMRVRDSILAAICQMVSEATANAARHGQADRVDVSIKAASVGLAISISDNGVGIAEVKPKAEFGPQSIQARVADLGGEFQLDPSAPGLVMRILLPL